MKATHMAPPDLTALIDRLRKVGLSRYEASIYTGLLLDAKAKISEISKRTGVPQPKAYQALDSLVDKGFCLVGPDVVNRYRALPPEVAIAGFIEDLHEAERHATGLVTDLTDLQEEGEGQDLWAPPFEIVKGSRQVNLIVLERIESVKDTIRFFAKAPALPSDEVREALVSAFDRGVTMRCVYEEPYLAQEGVMDDVREMRALGVQDRVVDELPTKMVLFDKRSAMNSISTQRGEGFMALVLRHSGMVKHMLASFEHQWGRGAEFEA